MAKYLDYKATIWGRIYFKEEADLDKVIAKLEEGYLPSELCEEEELGFKVFESLLDTEEYLSPSENKGLPTIEIYNTEKEGLFFQNLIWDNVNKNKKD